MLPNISDFFDVFTSDWPEYEWVNKIQIFSQFVLLDLCPVKDGPYRPLPGGQKLHFCLAVFHKNFNILSVKSNSISSWKMEFWECGIADKVLKVIFENIYLWVTFGESFIFFFFFVFMLTYLFLVLKSSLNRQKSEKSVIILLYYVIEYDSSVILNLYFELSFLGITIIVLCMMLTFCTHIL